MKNTKSLKQRVQEIEFRLDRIEYWLQKSMVAINTLNKRTIGMSNGMKAFSKIVAEFIENEVEVRRDTAKTFDNVAKELEDIKEICDKCKGE